MSVDFELAADAVVTPSARETVVATVGLAAWTGGYVALRLVGGVLALCVWGAQAAKRAVCR